MSYYIYETDDCEYDTYSGFAYVKGALPREPIGSKENRELFERLKAFSISHLEQLTAAYNSASKNVYSNDSWLDRMKRRNQFFKLVTETCMDGLIIVFQNTTTISYWYEREIYRNGYGSIQYIAGNYLYKIFDPTYPSC